MQGLRNGAEHGHLGTRVGVGVGGGVDAWAVAGIQEWDRTSGLGIGILLIAIYSTGQLPNTFDDTTHNLRFVEVCASRI